MSKITESLKSLKKNSSNDIGEPDIREFWLVKHSSVELDCRWWFLDEVFDYDIWRTCSASFLESLKEIGLARFMKRYSSEEELELDVAIKYSGNYKLRDLGLEA